MKVLTNRVLTVAICGLVVSGALTMAGQPLHRLGMACFGVLGLAIFVNAVGEALLPRSWDPGSDAVAIPVTRLSSLGGGVWFGAFGFLFLAIAIQNDPELTWWWGVAFFGCLAVGVLFFLTGLLLFERLRAVSTVVGDALWAYADRHDGWFPRGEASPEASLGLLHRERPDQVTADVLRGMTAAAGSCGWHYVEGLRKDDDPGLALFWDRTEPGRLYTLLAQGGHVVFFVGGAIDYVPRDRWEAFQAEQERLRAAVRR